MRYLAAAAILIAAPAGADPLVVDHDRLFIKAEINGVPTEALLDSGAEATLIDRQFAAAVKLPAGDPIEIKGSGGVQQAAVVSGVSVIALGQQLRGLDVVVMDLGDLSTRLIRRPTQVIVGRELFDAARLEIDIAGRQVRVLDRATKPRGLHLPLTAQHGIEAVPVIANGVPVLAELDLGNGSGVMVSKAFAERLKLKAVSRAQGGGIGGPVVRDIVVLPTLRVAGLTLRNVPAAVDALPNAGEVNIGTSVLRHFVVTTDFKNRSVWLAKARS